MTQEVKRSFSSNFQKRAEECHRAAQESFSRSDWTAATICAVHGCISACDAICVHFLGKRHSGEHHRDAVELFKSIKPDEEIYIQNGFRLRRILAIKNMAEYEERLVYRSEAEKSVKRFRPFSRVYSCNFAKVLSRSSLRITQYVEYFCSMY